MNDNTRRAVQWQRLVGEFMPTHLGGTPEEWAEANRTVFGPMWDEFLQRLSTYEHFADFDREYSVEWLRRMCGYVRVPTPSDDDAFALTYEASRYITRRVQSWFEGVPEAVRTLRDAGFVLHTASGETSYELDGYLSGMGVRACFEGLYGPDIVDRLKDRPEYYRRVFAHAGVDPAEALVIDDKPECCGWAAEAGAAVVRIGTPVDGLDAEPTLALLAGRLLR